MASTQVGIVRLADGTITAVVNPTDDAALDNYPLKAGETLVKLTKATQYNIHNAMTALAAANGWKVK